MCRHIDSAIYKESNLLVQKTVDIHPTNFRTIVSILCRAREYKRNTPLSVSKYFDGEAAYYAIGLHRDGSEAVFRYTNLKLSDHYRLMQDAFGE